MLQERIEGKWIEAFAAVFRRCDVKAGLEVAILSETQSRPVTVALAELALLSLGARPFHVVVPTPPQRAGVPVRSTGASDALQGAKPVVSRARPVGHGRRLHGRGPAARARAAADPRRGRARADDLERASRGARAARPDRRPRGQGEGGHPPAARGEADARHLARGHGPLRLARGRVVGGGWGYTSAAGHHHALARRALPLLPRARQRRAGAS